MIIFENHSRSTTIQLKPKEGQIELRDESQLCEAAVSPRRQLPSHLQQMDGEQCDPGERK